MLIKEQFQKVNQQFIKNEPQSTDRMRRSLEKLINFIIIRENNKEHFLSKTTLIYEQQLFVLCFTQQFSGVVEHKLKKLWKARNQPFQKEKMKIFELDKILLLLLFFNNICFFVHTTLNKFNILNILNFCVTCFYQGRWICLLTCSTYAEINCVKVFDDSYCIIYGYRTDLLLVALLQVKLLIILKQFVPPLLRKMMLIQIECYEKKQALEILLKHKIGLKNQKNQIVLVEPFQCVYMYINNLI